MALETLTMTFPVMDFPIPNWLVTDWQELGVERVHRAIAMILHKSIGFCSFIQQELNLCN